MQRLNGGCTFAEDPDRDARSARIIWRADLDPGALLVDAFPADPRNPEALRMARIFPFLTIAKGAGDWQHAVLSDGCQHIRLDVVTGQLTEADLVELHVRFEGLRRARAGVRPLQRLLALARHGRFAASLRPRDPVIARGITALRVYDALSQGASNRDLTEILFGAKRIAQDGAAGSDSLRSRVRRLAREARAFAAGGYRSLLQKGER